MDQGWRAILTMKGVSLLDEFDDCPAARMSGRLFG